MNQEDLATELGNLKKQMSEVGYKVKSILEERAVARENRIEKEKERKRLKDIEVIEMQEEIRKLRRDKLSL